MNKPRKIALFDVDGVIYDGHTIFDQIQDQEKRGVIAKGTWNKILIELGEYKTGKKSYKQAADAMLKIHALSIKGRDFETIVDDTFDYLSRNRNRFFPYFGELVTQLKKTYDIYFVTTNFQFMCKALGKIFGINNYFSSIAEIKNGKFTGKVDLSLGGNKGIVSNLIEKYGRKGSIAVGDSKNDKDMLDEVEFPIVMEPDEKLKLLSEKQGWKIVNRQTIAEVLRACL